MPCNIVNALKLRKRSISLINPFTIRTCLDMPMLNRDDKKRPATNRAKVGNANSRLTLSCYCSCNNAGIYSVLLYLVLDMGLCMLFILKVQSPLGKHAKALARGISRTGISQMDFSCFHLKLFLVVKVALVEQYSPLLAILVPDSKSG